MYIFKVDKWFADLYDEIYIEKLYRENYMEISYGKIRFLSV